MFRQMGMKRSICLSFLSLFVSMSLLTPILAQEKMDKYPGNIIYFGYGGGFTGLVYKYALLENGDVYKKQPFEKDSFELINKVLADQLISIFNNYEFLGIDSMQLNDPGNTYTYVTFCNAKKQEKKIVWNRTLQIPGNLKTFYNQLIDLIPKQ